MYKKPIQLIKSLIWQLLNMRRQTMVLSTLSFIAIIIGGIKVKSSLDSGVQTIVSSNLESMLKHSVRDLKHWHVETSNKAKDIIVTTDIVTNIELLTKPTLHNFTLTKDLKSRISLKTIETFGTAAHFVIIDLQGKVLLKNSNYKLSPSLLKTIQPQIVQGRTSPLILWDKPKQPNGASNEMVILTPVIKYTEIIAYAVYIHIPTTTLSEILLNSSLGDTGKSYLLRGDGSIICGSHLSEEANFNEHSEHSHIDTDSIDNTPTFPDSELKLVPYNNYNNIKTVGAWTYLKDWDITLVIEVSSAEVYALLLPVQRLFTWGAVTIVLVVLLLGLISYLANKFNAKYHLARKTINELDELGQYKLIKKIGEGAHGVVYEAKHQLMQRNTVIKFLKPELCSDKNVQSFTEEVKLCSKLEHPNTIKIYDYGQTVDGLFYYVMEFLNGIDLDKIIKQFGPLPPERVIFILNQICSSLQEAHALNLIHRDIKPQNILLCKQGGEFDVIKVLDFSLATRIKELNNTGDTIHGTPNYIAPEVITDQNVDHLADLYSLGITGYYLLTGKYPFESNENSVSDILRQHLNEPPITISNISSVSIPKDLENVILSCLEKDKLTRPQSAKELASLLKSCSSFDQWSSECAERWWTENIHPTPNIINEHIIKTVKLDRKK
ncbi:protein kinase [Lentisphaera marina]|uniref:serine/threonine protein kinase n=1 Tax=Lentisphaera marina TaxID=1111041 RepID=UPI002366158A|nr:serine/threonine-protein kinase [Lentisphaera marina]MDD7984346.1 protein kinase [Lentisphaera marina]